MTDEKKILREKLETEAKEWVQKEFARRYQAVRETLEKQAKESEHHLHMMGINDTSRIASEAQLSISMAKSELMSDVKFEADQWVEEELKKRLNN